MGTRGTWTAFSVILLACVLLSAAGCPHKVKSAAKTIQALATSPPLVSAERTAYDLGQAEWGPWFFSAGLYQGKPIVAYRSAGGLSLAVANTPLPQEAGDWQVMLLDSQPKARFVHLAASDDGVFISYMTGPRDDTHLMLASCLSTDPADPQAWKLEELPDELGCHLAYSIEVIDGKLGLACTEQETRRPMYIWRELANANADWNMEAADEITPSSPDLKLLDLDGRPALGYTSKDHTTLGLLLGPGPDSHGWRDTNIACGADMHFNQGNLDMVTQGKSACAVFLEGRDDIALRFATTADATAADPVWQISEIVSWNMLGDADLLHNGALPVVVYNADMNALWAFFTTTATPAGHRDWRMCKLSEDLGTEGYNGVEAQIIDGHLLALYIKLDSAKNVTLSATLIEIPEL